MKSKRITTDFLLSLVTPEAMKRFEQTRDNFFNFPEARAEESTFRRAFHTPCSSHSLNLGNVSFKYTPEQCKVYHG